MDRSLAKRWGGRGQGQLEHRGILAPSDGLVVAAARAHLFEAEGLVEPDRHDVRGTHLEEGFGHAGRVRTLEQADEDLLAAAAAAALFGDAQVEDVRLV